MSKLCIESLLVVSLVATLTSCYLERVIDYELRPSSSPTVNGESATNAVYQPVSRAPDVEGVLHYQDEILEVEWRVFSYWSTIKVANLGTEPIHIVWSEAFLDDIGEPTPIYLATSGFRDDLIPPQQPTVVVPGEATDVLRVIVGQSVRWQGFTNDPDRGFMTGGRFTFNIQPTAPDVEVKAIGRDVTLHLPIENDSFRRVYSLPAQVSNLRIRTVRHVF